MDDSKCELKLIGLGIVDVKFGEVMGAWFAKYIDLLDEVERDDSGWELK